MHPIEQLRFVARSRGVDSRLLLEETSSGLGFFGAEPRALITACRQLLSRQPGVGPLWWLCSRMILADDPRTEGQRALVEFRLDPTRDHLSHELDRARSRSEVPAIVVISSDAAGLGPDGRAGALLTRDNEQAMLDAGAENKHIWLTIGEGSWLPESYWEEIKRRCSGELVLVDLAEMDKIIGVDGSILSTDLAPSIMVIAPELLVRLN